MKTPFYDAANNSWKIKVKVDGLWKARTLSKGRENEAAALAAASLLFQPEPIVVVKPLGDLADYADRYCRQHPSASSREGNRRRVGLLKRFVVWASEQGLDKVEHVTHSHMKNYVESRLSHTKHSTIVSDLACIQGMFSEACRDELVTKNPVTQVARTTRIAERKNRGKEDKIKYYTREQQCRVVDALRFALPKYRDLAYLMLATGLRVEAARNIEASWITKDWYVDVPQAHDKGGKGYRTYVFLKDVPAIREILEWRMKENPTGRLFGEIASDSRPYHYFAEYYLRHKMADIHELAHYNHIFRHSFAVRRVENGMAVHILQKFLGHHDIKITQIYATPSEDALGEAVAAINAMS